MSQPGDLAAVLVGAKARRCLLPIQCGRSLFVDEANRGGDGSSQLLELTSQQEYNAMLDSYLFGESHLRFSVLVTRNGDLNAQCLT